MSFWKTDWTNYVEKTERKEFSVKIFLPKQLQKELKIRCAHKGLSQRAYLTELVLHALGKDTKK